METIKTIKLIEPTKRIICETCTGSGFIKRVKDDICPNCNNSVIRCYLCENKKFNKGSWKLCTLCCGDGTFKQ